MINIVFMSTSRIIYKYLKLVLRKLAKWESKNKYMIDYDSLRRIIIRDFEILRKKGLKFNIHKPLVKLLLLNELERICCKMERNENIDSFNILFELNSENNDNEELSELEKHRTALNPEIYRPILESMYDNQDIGQPNRDPVMIYSILYLQAKYDLSDEQVLKDIKDRASFQYFLGFPEKLPCSTTIGNFRDRIIEYCMIDPIWFQHQQQLAIIGYNITRELAMDAAFLDTNPGSYNKPRGELAQTRRSKDGTHMTKNKEHHYGFKTHVAMDLKYQLIRIFTVTTAAVHDSQITFDFREKYIMYADKGYIGARFNCFKGHMLRKSNDPRINAHRTQRNLRISRKRAPVERIFSAFQEHGQNFSKLTTTARNKVKILFASLLYNVKQIIYLQKENSTKKKSKTKETEYKTLFYILESTPKMVENREKVKIMKQKRQLRIKNSIKKYLSMFKPKKRKKSKPKRSQKPNKKRFNRKLAYSF